MTVMRIRKRLCASALEGPTALVADILRLTSPQGLVLRCGQTVRDVINRIGRDMSTQFSQRGQPVQYDERMSSTNGSGSVAVLAKAMALVDHIAEEGEVTPARLAELTGEPRSSVYRLLASLQELELVEPGRRRGTYMLGLKLFRLGRAVVSRFDERQAALPVMRREPHQG